MENRGSPLTLEAGWDQANKQGKREGGRRGSGGRSGERAGHAPRRVVCGVEQRTDKQMQVREVGTEKHADQRQERREETGTFTTTTAQRLAPTAPNSNVGVQGLTRFDCRCTLQSGNHRRDNPPTQQQIKVTAPALTHTPWRRHKRHDNNADEATTANARIREATAKATTPDDVDASNSTTSQARCHTLDALLRASSW